MFIINISSPVNLLLVTIATVLLIFLGKELKKSYVPAIALFVFLALVVMHCIQLATLTDTLVDTYYHTLVKCISLDCIMIFVSFFAYLWVDDISCKFYKKKSIDNSLDWFWNKL